MPRLRTSKVRLVYLYLYRMVKKVLRIPGGPGHLERICSSEHTPASLVVLTRKPRQSRDYRHVHDRHYVLQVLYY